MWRCVREREREREVIVCVKKRENKGERERGWGGEKMIQDPSKKPVNLNEKGWPALEQESNDLTAGAQFTRSESPDDQMSADV